MKHSVCGILSIIFGAISICFLGSWLAYFPMATAVVLGMFCLADHERSSATGIVGVSLAVVAMLICSANLLLRNGPSGTIISSAKKALNAEYNDEEYDDDYYDDDEYYDDEDYDDEDYDGGDYDYGFDDEDYDSSDEYSDEEADQDTDGYDDADMNYPSDEADDQDDFVSGSAGSGNLDTGDVVRPSSSANSYDSYDSDDDYDTGDDSDDTESDAEAYQEIYDEYSAMLKEATPTLIEELLEEAEDSDDDISVLAQDKVNELWEIAEEGIDMMDDYLSQSDSQDTAEYDKWSGQLYKVYEEESNKIMSSY